MLRTWNLQRSLRFYVDTLGFSCDRFSDEWGWAALNHGEVALMLATPNEHDGATRPAFTRSLYLRTDDVDTLWTALAGKAEVVYPPQDFDYGMREFAIRDDSGYVLQFGQPLRDRTARE